MDFDKRLKGNLIMYISYVIIGALIYITSTAAGNTESMIHSLGVVFAVIGAVGIVRTLRMRADSTAYEKAKTAAQDERIIAINAKAGNLTFMTCVYVSSIAIIALACYGMEQQAVIIARCLCGLCIIHAVYRAILSKIM